MEGARCLLYALLSGLLLFSISSIHFMSLPPHLAVLFSLNQTRFHPCRMIATALETAASPSSHSNRIPLLGFPFACINGRCCCPSYPSCRWSPWSQAWTHPDLVVSHPARGRVADNGAIESDGRRDGGRRGGGWWRRGRRHACSLTSLGSGRDSSWCCSSYRRRRED